MTKILASGLGGGLDMINASLIYYAAKNEGLETVLCSSRPAPLSVILNHKPFSDNGTWINGQSFVNYGRPGRSRYCEPRISSYIGEEMMYVSTKFNEDLDIPRLSKAVSDAQENYEFTKMFFVDGGGDSMTLTMDDAAGSTENMTSPFEGGDSHVLQALSGLKDTVLGVISVGLDVSEVGFQKNIKRLEEKNAYYGRVNLSTGEKDNYKLEHFIQFKKGFLDNYFNLAEKILVLNEQDLSNPMKTISHTGVVTFHALKGNYGYQRTFAPWIHEDPRGTLVKPEHAWMYFFDASQIHPLKVELNKNQQFTVLS